MIDKLDSYPGVPQHLFEGLKAYALHGVPPGSFVRACLENDLVGVVLRADADSMRAVPAIVSLLVNHLPARSYGRVWGSPTVVDAWVLEKADEREAPRGGGGA